MNIRNYIIVLIFSLGLTTCKKTEKTTKKISSDLSVDHLNIWVENPEKARDKLVEIGFNTLPDSLIELHKGQGTTGKYFNFLNSYLELIYVYNQKDLENNNKINKDLDFVKRANFISNGASPFSLALKMKDYNIEKIPFKKIKYHQEWMERDFSIYSAKNSNINIKEPSIFVVYPIIEAKNFDSLEDVDKIPEEYDFYKKTFKHKNDAQKITKIIITSKGLETNSETINVINGIKNVVVRNGSEHLMELYFDNNIQGKTFDLRPELPLIIYF